MSIRLTVMTTIIMTNYINQGKGRLDNLAALLHQMRETINNNCYSTFILQTFRTTNKKQCFIHNTFIYIIN